MGCHERCFQFFQEMLLPLLLIVFEVVVSNTNFMFTPPGFVEARCPIQLTYLFQLGWHHKHHLAGYHIKTPLLLQQVLLPLVPSGTWKIGSYRIPRPGWLRLFPHLVVPSSEAEDALIWIDAGWCLMVFMGKISAFPAWNTASWGVQAWTSMYEKPNHRRCSRSSEKILG